jgi:activator of HSP90 ATPase
LLSKFGPDLLETHGKDIQHPDASIHSNSSSVTPASLSTASLSSSSVVGTAAYNTTSLRLEPVFNAPAHQLYDALLKPDMVALWTRSKPDIAPVVGTNYTLFNGTISGKITDLVENSRIEMTWRLKDWKQAHFAILSLDFLQGAGETTIKVNWTGVPIGQEEVVQTNFEEYYVKPIKLTFGFGTVL